MPDVTVQKSPASGPAVQHLFPPPPSTATARPLPPPGSPPRAPGASAAAPPPPGCARPAQRQPRPTATGRRRQCCRHLRRQHRCLSQRHRRQLRTHCCCCRCTAPAPAAGPGTPACAGHLCGAGRTRTENVRGTGGALERLSNNKGCACLGRAAQQPLSGPTTCLRAWQQRNGAAGQRPRGLPPASLQPTAPYHILVTPLHADRNAHTTPAPCTSQCRVLSCHSHLHPPDSCPRSSLHSPPGAPPAAPGPAAPASPALLLNRTTTPRLGHSAPPPLLLPPTAASAPAFADGPAPAAVAVRVSCMDGNRRAHRRAKRRRAARNTAVLAARACGSSKGSNAVGCGVREKQVCRCCGGARGVRGRVCCARAGGQVLLEASNASSRRCAASLGRWSTSWPCPCAASTRAPQGCNLPRADHHCRLHNLPVVRTSRLPPARAVGQVVSVLPSPSVR